MWMNASTEGVVKFGALVADDHDRGVLLRQMEHGTAEAVDGSVVADEPLDLEDAQPVAGRQHRAQHRVDELEALALDPRPENGPIGQRRWVPPRTGRLDRADAGDANDGGVVDAPASRCCS